MLAILALAVARICTYIHFCITRCTPAQMASEVAVPCRCCANSLPVFGRLPTAWRGARADAAGCVASSATGWGAVLLSHAAGAAPAALADGGAAVGAGRRLPPGPASGPCFPAPRSQHRRFCATVGARPIAAVRRPRGGAARMGRCIARSRRRPLRPAALRDGRPAGASKGAPASAHRGPEAARESG